MYRHLLYYTGSKCSSARRPQGRLLRRCPVICPVSCLTHRRLRSRFEVSSRLVARVLELGPLQVSSWMTASQLHRCIRVAFGKFRVRTIAWSRRPTLDGELYFVAPPFLPPNPSPFNVLLVKRSGYKRKSRWLYVLCLVTVCTKSSY